VVAGLHEHADNPTYKTRNWPSLDPALKSRGSLTIRFDPIVNSEIAPTGKRGRPRDYSDATIQTRLTMKVLFGMALRPTTGLVESPLRLIGLDRTVPDLSSLSRRQGEMGPWRQLRCASPLRPEGEHPLSLVGWSAASAGGHRADERQRSERTCEAGSRLRAKASGTPASMAVPNAPRHGFSKRW